MKSHVRELKESFYKVNDVCHNTICASFKNGSREEGNNFKILKNDLKLETDEAIALVSGYLSDLEVDFQISGLTFDTSSLSISSKTRFSDRGDSNNNVSSHSNASSISPIQFPNDSLQVTDDSFVTACLLYTSDAADE